MRASKERSIRWCYPVMAITLASLVLFYFQSTLVYTAASSNHHVYQNNIIEVETKSAGVSKLEEETKSAAVSRLEGETKSAAVSKLQQEKSAAVSKLEEETKSAAVSKLEAETKSAAIERMKMYKERYNYHPPKRHDNHTNIDEICGLSPNYEKFFGYDKYSRSSSNEDKTIYELFFKNGEAKGSVVEMGAFTGIQESNSRFFDLCLGWETLLVEGMPKSFEQVITNRPNSHNFNFVPSCSEADEVANKTIKFDNYPMTNAGVNDGSVTTSYSGRNWTVDVPCGSLTKVLLDIFPSGHVSFFSLDVEGSEPSVLRALDFKKVFIEVMIIETSNNFCTRFSYCESRNQFRKIMRDEGYVLFEKIVSRSDLFIHPLSVKHLQAMEERGHKAADWNKAVVNK